MVTAVNAIGDVMEFTQLATLAHKAIDGPFGRYIGEEMAAKGMHLLPVAGVHAFGCDGYGSDDMRA